MVTRASTTEGKAAPVEFAIDVLTHAVRHYEQLVEEGEEGYRPEYAARALELARLQQEAGSLSGAMATVEAAVASYRRLAATEPEPYKARLAGALNLLGALRADAGDHEGALDAFEESVSLWTGGDDGG
jgi:tetratricopeptide (TPR) repeat protein